MLLKPPFYINLNLDQSWNILTRQHRSYFYIETKQTVSLGNLPRKQRGSLLMFSIRRKLKAYRWRFGRGVHLAGCVITMRRMRHLLRDDGYGRQGIRLFLLHLPWYLYLLPPKALNDKSTLTTPRYPCCMSWYLKESSLLSRFLDRREHFDVDRSANRRAVSGQHRLTPLA